MLTNIYRKSKNISPSIPPTTVLPASPISASQQNNRYIIAATSDNTRKAYQADIHHYENWGGPLPASTEDILRYLHAFAETLNPNTLAQRLIALKQWHSLQQFADPTEAPIEAKTVTGIRRLHGCKTLRTSPLKNGQVAPKLLGSYTAISLLS